MASTPKRVGERLLTVSAALLFYGQMLLFGANSRLLAAFAATAEIGFALICLLALSREVRKLPAWRTFLPAALLVAAVAWLAAVDIRFPHRSDATWIEGVKLLGAGALALASAWIGLNRERMRWLVIALVALGGIYCLVSLGLRDAHAVLGVAKPLNMTRFSGTLLNPNAAATVFAMIALLALGLLFSTFQRWQTARRGVSVATAIVALLVVVTGAGCCLLTASRAVAAMLIVLIVVVLAANLTGRGVSRRLLAPAAAVLGLVLLVGGGALYMRGLDVSDGFQARRTTLEILWNAVLAQPWIGAGAGATPRLIAAGLDQQNVAALWNIRSAHFAALELVVDGGAPYAGLILVAVATVIAQLFFTRRGAWGGDRPIRLALICALLLVAAESCVDIAMNVPAVAALAAMLLGCLWGRALDASSTSRRDGPGSARDVERPAQPA